MEHTAFRVSPPWEEAQHDKWHCKAHGEYQEFTYRIDPAAKHFPQCEATDQGSEYRGRIDVLVIPGKVRLERIVEALTEGPRRAFRLSGGLQPGQRADITVIDPDAQWMVDPSEFLSKGRATPFEGKQVRGRIVLTLKDGEPVWQL